MLPVLLVVLGIAVAGAAGWVFVGRAWFAARQEAAVITRLRTDPRIDPRAAEAADAIAERIAQIAERGEDLELLLSLGNQWKSVGDLTGNPEHYERADAAYVRASAAADGKNSVVLQNRAVVLRLLKRPQEAEQVLREAIQANPGEPALYVALIDLMRVDLKSEHTAIIDAYRDGIDHLVDNAPIVQSLAGYLEDVGRLEEALTYYRLLAVNHPGFEDKIASLTSRIASQP